MKNLKRNLGFMTFILLVVLGNLSFGASSDSEEKVAVVCFLEGKAWVSDPAQKERNEIDLFDWVKIGAIIETDPEAKLVLAFSNGERYELSGKTRSTVGQNELVSSTGSLKKLTQVPVMPKIASISQESRPGSKLGGIRLRSWDKFFSELYPNIGDTVIASKAVVTFEHIKGIKEYRVEIEDEWGNIIFAVETASHEVVISPGILKPGTNYYLRVRTLEKGKTFTGSEVVFATLSEEDSRLRKAFKEQVDKSKDVVDLLLLAQMEIALGLRKEACETLKTALALFPDNSKINNAMVKTGCK